MDKRGSFSAIERPGSAVFIDERKHLQMSRVITLVRGRTAAYTTNIEWRWEELYMRFASFLKLLVSLHSLRLIVISAVTIIYMAMTNANSKKIEAVNEESAPITIAESNNVMAAVEIDGLALQPTGREEK